MIIKEMTTWETMIKNLEKQIEESMVRARKKQRSSQAPPIHYQYNSEEEEGSS